MKLDQVKAVITGGASGLGHATVKKFLENGASVAIFDFERSTFKDTIKELDRKFQGRFIFVNVDVTDTKSVEKGIDITIKKFTAINVLVNCAGIATARKTISKDGVHPLDLYKKVIDVNLIGTFNMVRLTASVMERNSISSTGEKGCIINTASVAAFDGQKGQAAYAASKGGVASSTLPLARDMAASAIRVNAIAPGLFLTPMLKGLPIEAQTELAHQVVFPKRLGHPDEFAKLALFIVNSEYMNGETVRIDGAIRLP